MAVCFVSALTGAPTAPASRRHPRPYAFHFTSTCLLLQPIRRSQYLLQPRQVASLWFYNSDSRHRCRWRPVQHFGENSVHRYAPTSPSAPFNHKKKPLLPGCVRCPPSRSLARGAQQQPSPPHSGRGHSTGAYTHRHFPPLPSLVRGCCDGPLALAQAGGPKPPHATMRVY
jgi:hypothetical protein